MPGSSQRSWKCGGRGPAFPRLRMNAMRKTRRRRILPRYRCSAARGEHRTCMGGSCICRDRSARCRRWSVRTAAKCSGPCTAERPQRLQGQTSVAAPGTAVCRRQEMAAMCRCRLGCRIRLSTRHHRRRRPWRAWCIVDQPCMGDRVLTPRGSPAYPTYTVLRPPALRAGFNLSYATSGAAAAGHPGHGYQLAPSNGSR